MLADANLANFMKLSNLVFVAMVTVLLQSKNFYKFCFAHCIHQPNLSFKALMTSELFRIADYAKEGLPEVV